MSHTSLRRILRKDFGMIPYAYIGQRATAQWFRFCRRKKRLFILVGMLNFVGQN